MAFEFRRMSAVVLIAAVPVILSACNGTSGKVPSNVNVGANRAETYPDITALVHAETTQMSNEDAAKYSANLSALAARRQSGAISEAEYRRQLAEMEALRANHGEETLQEIRNAN